MHLEIAGKLFDLLNKEFPMASLALTGSVASGKHNKNSDIDIIFVNNDFSRSYLLNFSIDKIKIGLFILNKNIINHNNLVLQGYHVAQASLISQAKIYCDPDNKIKDIISRLKELYEKRDLVNNLLISDLKKKISLLLSTETNSLYENKNNYIEIINTLQIIFFLKKANRPLTKHEQLNPFNVIKEIDKFMYDTLLNCIPFNENSITNLRQFYSSYFINHY